MMRRKILMTSVALVFGVTQALADFPPPPPPPPPDPTPPSAQSDTTNHGGKRWKFNVKGYVLGATFVAAGRNIYESVEVGNRLHRQRTMCEALETTADSYVPFIGGAIVRANCKDNPQVIKVAERAWKFYQTAQGKELLWMCRNNDTCDNGMAKFTIAMGEAYRTGH